MKKIFIAIFGSLAGLVLGYIIFLQGNSILPKKQVIGFLPYFLLNHAKTDYSAYITTLTYFGLRVNGNGSIMKLTNPQEEEPGWYALKSGKLNPFFAKAKQSNISLSLLISDGSQESIDSLLANPVSSGKTLVSQVSPIMKQYGFSDLNLDIESVMQASSSARENFLTFAKTVKESLVKNKLGTLTIEISPTDLIKKDLIDPLKIAPVADYVVVMGYDYHYTGSYVTGPVAPLYGAGVSLEYDVATAINKAKKVIPENKIILGIPFYGYSWETIGNTIQSAVIPDTGIVESTRTVSDFLKNCATCSARFNSTFQEPYFIYKNTNTGTYQQTFYPNELSTRSKVEFANTENLGGIAIWALGYEDSNILTPLETYKNSL